MTLNRVIALIVTIGAILIGIFFFGLYPKSSSQPIETSQQTEDNSGVRVVGGNLSKDELTVISPTQPLEVVFNKPMVQDTTRISIDPQIAYKIELSNDHKTIKIIPEKTLDLGKDYTLTIKNGYGTDTGEKLDSDQVFHFKTINYTGV